jgi:hypothetical protein
MPMLLDFSDPDGPRHFEFCFVGFVLGGSLQDKKNLTVMRREVALFGKLETISELKPCGKKMVNGEPERQLAKEGVRQIELEVGEFDLLYGYLSIVPWQTGTPVRQAVETLDWLQAAQRERTT